VFHPGLLTVADAEHDLRTGTRAALLGYIIFAQSTRRFVLAGCYLAVVDWTLIGSRITAFVGTRSFFVPESRRS
jgi:hypothetical protein